MVAREHGAGAGKSGLHLVGDEHHVVVAGPPLQRGQETVGRNDEAASPAIGSMMTAARLAAPICLSMRLMARSAASSPSVAMSLSSRLSR
ncbi:hypothetical protein I551_9148 [Mycobacterium ulcerans str. Harvey]|uniref:Uncharacterized protein n=1 Tax=Mycobacterium ulcerans str. Harvey TaxID=1299332 RepID=A0ABN0R8Z0_MYCUL|nr:hypothetical protein I551_9148 [Mycobacterium ulcerans str. Harvey]